MGRALIAGNWKMNLERKSALGLAVQLRERVGAGLDVDVGVFPPFVYVDEVARALAGSPIVVGGQNCCDEREGAFTGEVSAAQLVDVGARAVILGHSERRQLFGEGDDLVRRKVAVALEAGLDVVLCVGETLEERRAKATEKVISRQLVQGLSDLAASDLPRVTIAYEPVWAIGTGQVATPAQAHEAHAYLRGVLAGMHNEAAARATRILYGGSVKEGNVRDLLASPEVDGALVGGASIRAETFLPLLDGR